MSTFSGSCSSSATKTATMWKKTVKELQSGLTTLAVIYDKAQPTLQDLQALDIRNILNNKGLADTESFQIKLKLLRTVLDLMQKKSRDLLSLADILETGNE